MEAAQSHKMNKIQGLLTIPPTTGPGRVSESEHPIITDIEAGAKTMEETPQLSIPIDAVPSARRRPTDKFSTHQIVYITVMHGLGAMLISGGINFGIAYGKKYASR